MILIGTMFLLANYFHLPSSIIYTSFVKVCQQTYRLVNRFQPRRRAEYRGFAANAINVSTWPVAGHNI